MHFRVRTRSSRFWVFWVSDLLGLSLAYFLYPRRGNQFYSYRVAERIKVDSIHKRVKHRTWHIGGIQKRSNQVMISKRVGHGAGLLIRGNRECQTSPTLRLSLTRPLTVLLCAFLDMVGFSPGYTLGSLGNFKKYQSRGTVQ